MRCSIARALDCVGSWWSLLIIRDAMMGARRFKHFEASLGVAKNTLSARLSDLVDAGILEKVPAADGSRFEEYVLTQGGRELAPVIIALAQWGDRWVAHPDGPSTRLLDAATGDALRRLWPARPDGAVMELNEIRMDRASTAPALVWNDGPRSVADKQGSE